jgi:hypothetical protein
MRIYEPDSPPNDYIFASYDAEGRYSAQPLKHGTDSDGRRFPLAQPSEKKILKVAEQADALRATVREDLLDSLRGVPCENPAVFHEYRIDHFYRALGMRTDKSVIISDVRELPRNDFTAPFHEDPMLIGKAFPYPGLILMVNRAELGVDHEATLVPEKAHSAGAKTFVVHQRDSSLSLVRGGFGISNPKSEKLGTKGEIIEEAQAELWAGVYADLFLPRRDTAPWEPSPGQTLVVPGKYLHKERFGGQLPAALALELLVEKDPALLDALAARTTLKGHREFIGRINKLLPGTYSFARDLPVDDRYMTAVLKKILTSDLYGGDLNAVANLGSAARAFVVKRLVDYQQTTGYSFGLSPEMTGENPRSGRKREAIALGPGAQSSGGDSIASRIRAITDAFRGDVA